MQYIFQSVESADLDASSGVIHMLESSGKKLSASSSALSDIVQCERLKTRAFPGSLAEQRDAEQCSFDKELSDDDPGGASARNWHKRPL